MRANPRLRRKATERRRRFLRVNWWLIPAVGAFTGAVVGLYLAFSPATPAWWSGFVVGSVVAASVGSLWWLVYEQDGGRGLRMGNWAERETTSILKKRRDWRVFWPVAFEGMDVDQVAIGPTGVFVFETKHTSVEWRLGPEGLYSPKCDPLPQARKSANKIRAPAEAHRGSHL